MDERYQRARVVANGAKQRLWESFRKDSNILGAAFGRRIVGGEYQDEPALVIYVARKVPALFLPPSRLLPRRVFVGSESVEVDVFETGPFYPFSFTSRDRPASSGISIGRAADQPIDAGTLGCLVTDNTDQTLSILSCNHVLANENAGSIGDAIVQPGTIDNGTSPADNIATLKRFVTIMATGNTVDCAIAQVDDQTLGNTVVNSMKNNLMPVPTSDHPAVGLLFAGACNRTMLNPISSVLSGLNINFLSGTNATATAEVGMHVEKVGRTTEYTTADVTEIDVTFSMAYNFGPATFDNQIATAAMAQPGDSGSVVCKGGKGGTSDMCGSCGTSSAVADALGIDTSVDQAVVEDFRDKHFRHSQTGAYLVDLFRENEERIARRAQRTLISEADREYFRKLYDKHAHSVRMALLQPERTDFRITEEHVREIREGIKRISSHYLLEEEREPAEELLETIASLKGQTIKEALATLNTKQFAERMKHIMSKVKFLEQPRKASK